jgi:hypothetical protein
MKRFALSTLCGLIYGLSSIGWAQILFKNSSQAELGRFTQNGQLGIGISNVTSMLHIVGAGTTEVLRLQGLGISTTNVNILTIDDNGNVSKRTQSDWMNNDTQDLGVTSSGANNAQITLTNSPNVTVTGSGVVTVSTTPSTITINAPVPANYWTLNGASNIYNNNSGGKVGIGVTAPRYQLDIAYNTTAFNSSLHIGKGMADEGAYLSSGYPHQFVLSGGAAYNDNTNASMQAKSDKAASVASYQGNIYLATDMNLTAGSNFPPSHRMVLGAKGHVFIGDIPFAIGYEAFQPADGAKMDISQDAGRSQLHFHKGWSTAGGGYLTSGYVSQFAISGGTYFNGTGWFAEDATPSIIASYQGDIFFFTDQSIGTGNTFTPTQRMKITRTGLVGIGTTGTAPTHLLEVGTGGAWCDGTSWHDGSSRTLKNGITSLSLESAVETLKALQPVTFRYNNSDGDLRVGFIAEEVPDLVADRERKSLSAMDITAVVTKVVQQQQQAIQELREENQSLRQRLSKLETRL